MNRIFLCILFLISSVAAFSQKVYFVYLQSESGQPFFIKLGGKIQSSSGSGYLLLSQLSDSSYSFSVGFPQNKWPEQNFSVLINKKDHGFLLKDFGEKGWGLFDFQTLSVQIAASDKLAGEIKTEKKQVSAFTEILSKASRDPSLKEKSQAKVEEKKPVVAVSQADNKVEEKKPSAIPDVVAKTEMPSVLKDTIKKEAVSPPLVIEQPVVKKEEPKTEIKESVAEKKESVAEKKEEIKVDMAESYKPTLITRKSESSTTEGFGLVFIDDYGNGIKDTIRIIIPNIKPVVNEVKQVPKEEKKFLEISTDTALSSGKKEIVAHATKEDTISKPASHNNCKAMATEADFLKLRKNMASEITDEAMLNEAGKFFKAKCFTVLQIKNLSFLFLSDPGKYKFFDAAYSYVSDSEAYVSLQSELKDDYYINRFKAMLRN